MKFNLKEIATNICLINKLSDKEKLKYVIDNNDMFKLVLDNDITYIRLSDDVEIFLNDINDNILEEYNDSIINIYDEYLSNHEGVCNLLNIFNIKYEHV